VSGGHGLAKDILMKKFLILITLTVLGLWASAGRLHRADAATIIDTLGVGTTSRVSFSGTAMLGFGDATARALISEPSGTTVYYDFWLDTTDSDFPCGSPNLTDPNRYQNVLTWSEPPSDAVTEYKGSAVLNEDISAGDQLGIYGSDCAGLGIAQSEYTAIDGGTEIWPTIAAYIGTTPSPEESGSASLAYPENGMSTLDFKNWIVNVTPSASSTGGNVVVNYGPSTTLAFSDSAQYALGVSVDPFPVLKSTLLNPIVNLEETSSWYADVCYTELDTSSTCSSIINFTIDPTTPTPTSTAGVAAQTFTNLPPVFSSSTVSSSILANPYSCSGTILKFSVGSCVQYLIFSFAQILFQPTVGAQDYLSGAVSNFEAAPPFSGVFETYNNLTSAVSSTPPSQDLNYTLTLGDGLYVNATYTVPFLTSTTMQTAITPSGKSDLFSLEDAMFDLLTLGLIFFVPWHWWRHKQSHKNQT